jgi:inorganic triphosphatase YgiF
MTAAPAEIELKLWLRREDAEAFASLARLKRARPHQEQLRTIYFDTPDFKLARKGVALRVRRVGQRWLQTLKTEGERSGGLSKRLELETPVGTPAPDFSRLPAEVRDRLVRKKWRAALTPVFETRFRRTTWNLRTPDGSSVEVALDEGEILAGENSEALCEVELELKSGSADALYALAQAFAQQLLLIPFDASKAERGARLAAGKACKPVSAVLPVLERGMPVCAAFAQIVRACLAQLQANLPGLLLADDPEYLHQARVAVRRLRSAAGLFKKPCPPLAEEMARLANLGRALGEARDWDVFVLESLPGLIEPIPATQKTLMRRRAHAARRKARAAALDLVRSPGTAADLLSMHRWLHGLEAGQGEPRLIPFARAKLERLHEGVLAASFGFAEQSPEQRHALRIRVKRLRYALDYLGALFGGHKKFAACFAALQDELGALNDANTARRFLDRLNHDGRLDGLVEQFSRSLGERMQGRIEETDKTLREFSGLMPPWQ